MRNFTALLGSLLAANAFAQEPACVERLASQPYCLSLSSAAANCAKPHGEAEAIESCLKGYMAKLPPEKLNNAYRGLFYRMCLADVVIDTQSNKNKSLCSPAIAAQGAKPKASGNGGKEEPETAPAN